MALLGADTLTKRFGGLTAVNKVDLTVEAGELVGIIGPNGAGKTTLFNLLTGFLRPDRGTVVFRGAPITNLPPHRIVNRGLARTFQVARSFPHMTAWENVATACVCPRARRMSGGRDSRETAMEALAAVGLEGKAPLAAHTLPFGDLRRMEIARALATHPDVLLLDEPFSGLSASEVGPLTALLGALSQQGMTMLIVEHKLRELMRLVKRVVVLHFGEIISEGPPEEIARDPSVVEAYLGGKAWDDPIGGPG